MEFDAHLMKVCIESDAPPDFVDWLRSEGINSCLMVSLLAENSGEVEEKLISPSGCMRLNHRDKLCISVLWHKCLKERDSKDEPRRLGDGTVQLDLEDDERLRKNWWKIHGYGLPATRLLDSNSIGKLLSWVKRPRVLIEKLRLQELRSMAHFGGSDDTYLKMPVSTDEKSQQKCQIVKAVEDAVADNLDLLLRVNALFT